MADETLYDQKLSLDEIVFENRNKEYGAYDLRKRYPNYLFKAFLIGTLLFVLIAIIPFVVMKIRQMNAKEKTEVDANLVEVIQEDPILEQPQEEEPPPPPPPKKEPEPQEVIQNVVPEPKKVPKIETPPPTIKEQLTTTTGLQNQEGVKTPAYTPPPPQPSTGKGKSVEAKPPVNPNEVYTQVDQEAEYPGGMGALRKYLGDNFDTSLFYGDEGKLSADVKFVVERDGTVSDVKVVSKSGNRDFDDEAARVVKKLKKWKPAKLNGELVRSYYKVPFSMVFEY